MRRREFLKKAGVLGAAVAADGVLRRIPVGAAPTTAATRTHNAATLARRPYGKTGMKLSIIGLGGIVVSKIEQERADRIVAEAVEKGVNYFDVAPTYGDAELKLGPALQPYRKKTFLACKTTRRDAEGAEAELTRSLKRLRTDYVDLYQLHAITDVEKDVDAAFAKGGAMETFLAARKAGRVRYVGFPAHSVEAAMAAMDRFDFDSILFPVNFACWCAGNFGPQVIAKAREKGAAVLALKVLAYRAWPSRKDPRRRAVPKCWYEPLFDRDQAALGLRFALSQPVTAALPPGEPALYDLALDLAMNYKPLTGGEQEQVKRWAMKTKPMFRYDAPKQA